MLHSIGERQNPLGGPSRLCCFSGVARFARVVVPDVPHHVTQRGNARQVILGDGADRRTYLALLRQNCGLRGVSLLGYCLMSNHMHLITGGWGEGRR